MKLETAIDSQNRRVGEAEAKSRKRRYVEIRDPEMILTFVRTGFRITKREEEKV